MWKWYRWAAITSLAFHGATRIGEPLRARRKDLLLPSESGLDRPIIFLNISAPKPGKRGIGKVQHSRIKDATAVTLASYVFDALPRDELLYPASASTSRRRWDELLHAFQEVSLQNILWQMRIRHLATRALCPRSCCR